MSRAFALLFTLLLATDASAITRSEIMSRAKSYADEVWTSTSANTKASCTTGYESDYGPGTHTGLPYDWGGYVELDEFHAQLAAGQGAGSHSWHGVLSCTTGVDCSGYVSKCWKGPHKSTSTMHTVTVPISKEMMAPGDAWNDAGSHIVLWSGAADDGAPLFYEASGSAKKVRFNTAASWSYLVGYKPLRYQYVDDEGTPMAGGKDQPIVIGAFPFHHEYSTLATGSSIYGTYGCMPASGAENGPEVFYRIDLIQPGLLEAHVSDGAGVDIDLQLLSALDPLACITRDDLDIGPVALEPGTYWLIADSWSNASGTSYPGSYVLDVDFAATGPVPEPEDEEPPVVEDPPVEADAGGWAPEPDAGSTAPDAGTGEPDAAADIWAPATPDAGAPDTGSAAPGQDVGASWGPGAVGGDDAGGSFTLPGAGNPGTGGNPSQPTALTTQNADGGCAAAPGARAGWWALLLFAALGVRSSRRRATGSIG